MSRGGLLRNALVLAAVALAGVSLLTWVHWQTRERIAEQRQRAERERMAQVLPAAEFDNALLQDVLEIRDPVAFASEAPVRVYRARRGGQPVAAIFALAAPKGYNGPIHLLVGIRPDGSVSGVRVTAHRETPGLGDPIEASRSDWIHGFAGRSLTDPPPAGWAVRRDGGEFDQFTGATITPRAVVEAVQRALRYHERHHEEIYAPADD